MLLRSLADVLHSLEKICVHSQNLSSSLQANAKILGGTQKFLSGDVKFLGEHKSIDKKCFLHLIIFSSTMSLYGLCTIELF